MSKTFSSNFNSRFLVDNPPAYPPSFPLLPIILWHGIINPIAFAPLAEATALTAFLLFILIASSLGFLYDTVF